MKKVSGSLFVVAFLVSFATGCIEAIDPQNSIITVDQAANAPGAYDNFVNSITSNLVGTFTYSGDDATHPYDYGYPSFYLMRDVMGQDIVAGHGNNWYETWYGCSSQLGPSYARSQVPWTYYYKWIKNCNIVLSIAGEDPTGDKITGVGIAYAMRAMFYMDLARMYAQKTYALDKSSETVPIVKETTLISELAHNPRATNEDMWAFIISDLEKAEKYLANYTRANVYTPDISVVYGLKARAYLVMEDWQNAEKYAKLAQHGYSIMSKAEYTSRETGFNTPNSSWMFGVTYKATDPNILLNDGDSSWASWMCLEINPDVSGCGYASNYGAQMLIDRHLYETMPATDFRKNCFVDFAIDALGTNAEIEDALKAYTDYPNWVRRTGQDGDYKHVGGLSLKFRLAGGQAGHDNQYIGFVVAVPVMRVEEMYLIEAEAAGMQSESRGIDLLTTFAKTRDESYVYGTHKDAYGNSATSTFLNEVWWQRRVEFWGEGLATFDIKRLNKGIIRSYANTNHAESYRWNATAPPQWMNWCIVQTETNYNYSCTNNPTPIKPTSDSEEYVW
ncbi:MAG: RagB/SusD family nutrient uptake outer membrane protein [Prevotellaceae bacterium]|nr:RagB/SusD family nutrient uptake outer membrane protein [Prevotellaceae bacterium]